VRSKPDEMQEKVRGGSTGGRKSLTAVSLLAELAQPLNKKENKSGYYY